MKNKLITVALVTLLLVLVMASCEPDTRNFTNSQVLSPTQALPTLTLTPTKTSTQTATQTPTETSIPTVTPVPVYTKLGKQANGIAEILGWKIKLCDQGVQEDLVRGIFLYNESSGDLFCDFNGYSMEPIPPVFPQYILEFNEVKDVPTFAEDGYSFSRGMSGSIHFEKPYQLDITGIYTIVSDFLFSLGGDTYPTDINEIRSLSDTYIITLRMWPVTNAQSEMLGNYIQSMGMWP